jgi:hypothetical protein
MGDYLGVKDSAKEYKKLREMAPDMMKGFLEFDKAVFKDGAIPIKTKELMAITAAHVTQCPWCIDAQSQPRERERLHRPGNRRGGMGRGRDARGSGIQPRRAGDASRG